MKLYFITQNQLDFLKENIQFHLNHYSSPDNNWIYDVCGEDPFKELAGDFPEFQLTMGFPEPHASDYINSVSLYSSMATLSESIATDERLWAGMALKQFYNYVQYRWDFKTEITANKVQSHFFFDKGVRRSLTRNSISRLWWISKLSIDPRRENKFELTDILTESSSYIVDILERNFSNNPTIIRGLLEAIKQLRIKGVKITREIVRDLATHLTLLGGTFILDLFTEEEITEKLCQYTLELHVQ